MPKAVRCICELYWYVGLFDKGIELQTISQQIAHEIITYRERKELVDDDPLVVPAHQALCLSENLCARHSLSPQVVDDRIVKFEEGQVQLRNNEVDIVSRVANQGTPLPVPGDIGQLSLVIYANKQLVSVIEVIEIWAPCRSAAIERFKIEARRSKIAQFVQARMMQQETTIRGDVMRDKLP